MESSKKLAIILVSASLLIPLILLFVSLEVGFFDGKFSIVLLMMFIMLPMIALGAYMWITGKGQWAISGYNTMSKSQKEHYDAEKMAKGAGMVATIVCLACLLGVFPLLYMQNMQTGMIIFFVIIAIALIGSLAYYGTGKRYLKDPMRPLPPPSKEGRKVRRAIAAVSIITMAAIIIIVALFIGSGSVNATMDDEGLHINAPMTDRYLPYDGIAAVEISDNLDLGFKIGGFGGTSVLSGDFNNNEFGDYTLACYKDVHTYIIVKPMEGKTLVFNQSSVEETASFYNELLERLDGTTTGTKETAPNGLQVELSGNHTSELFSQFFNYG